MLVTRVYVNDRLIDIILIHNTSEMYDKKSTKYEIMDPLDKTGTERLTDTIVKHKQEDGYRKLLMKTLKILDKEKKATIFENI